MNNFEKAVKIIADEYRDDMERLGCDNIAEVFQCYWMDGNDKKSEFYSILTEATNAGLISFYYSDDCEILDEDGRLHTFGELSRAVGKIKRA